MGKLKPNKDILKEKTFLFAVRIVKLNQYLIKEKSEYILSKQIMRSGTNPGTMLREAAYAESGADFIHKLAVGRKEINEAIYWLEILFATEYINKAEYKSLYSDALAIAKLLTSSIKTGRRKLGIKIASVSIIIIMTISYLI